MERLRIGPVDVSGESGRFQMSSQITLPGMEPRAVWLEVVGASAPTATPDPFVALCLLPAMKASAGMEAADPISARLLTDGLPGVQRIFEIWRADPPCPRHPRFRSVAVTAEPTRTPWGAPSERVGSFFSGGVDSMFSLLEANQTITDLIFIDDFEGEFDATQARRALAGVSAVADRFGKNVIRVSTNAKDVLGPYVSWAYYHGAFLAGVALALQDTLGTVHVPSSVDAARLVPWGSHLLVDPLWSTQRTTIVHDRVDVTRLDKIRAISEDPFLLDHLRVCWEPTQNCGRCGKCVRTILALQALERFERGHPFDREPLTAREIARLDLREPRHAYYFLDSADLLQASGKRPELLRALRVAQRGRYHRGLGKVFRGDLRARIDARARAAISRARRAQTGS